MKYLIPFILFFLLLILPVCRSKQDSQISKLSENNYDIQKYTASIEKIFLAEDEGYSAIYYQVTWNGQEIIIPNTIHLTNYKVGDKISFITIKHDMSSKNEPDGPKILDFAIVPL